MGEGRQRVTPPRAWVLVRRWTGSAWRAVEAVPVVRGNAHLGCVLAGEALMASQDLPFRLVQTGKAEVEVRRSMDSRRRRRCGRRRGSRARAAERAFALSTAVDHTGRGHRAWRFQ